MNRNASNLVVDQNLTRTIVELDTFIAFNVAHILAHCTKTTTSTPVSETPPYAFLSTLLEVASTATVPDVAVWLQLHNLQLTNQSSPQSFTLLALDALVTSLRLARICASLLHIPATTPVAQTLVRVLDLKSIKQSTDATQHKTVRSLVVAVSGTSAHDTLKWLRLYQTSSLALQTLWNFHPHASKYLAIDHLIFKVSTTMFGRAIGTFARIYAQLLVTNQLQNDAWTDQFNKYVLTQAAANGSAIALAVSKNVAITPQVATTPLAPPQASTSIVPTPTLPITSTPAPKTATPTPRVKPTSSTPIQLPPVDVVRDI
jgi:hypothetical protein